METPQQIGKYKIEELIQNNSNEKIYYASDEKNQKVLLKEASANKKQSLINEYQNIQSFDHPNILKAIDYFELNNKSIFVTPKPESNLLDYLKNNNLNDETIHKIMHDLFSAVSYLNSRNICHRNIKLENILIYSDNQDKKYVLGGLEMAKHSDGVIINDKYTGFDHYRSYELLMFNSIRCMFFNQNFNFNFLNEI